MNKSLLASCVLVFFVFSVSAQECSYTGGETFICQPCNQGMDCIGNCTLPESMVGCILGNYTYWSCCDATKCQTQIPVCGVSIPLSPSPTLSLSNSISITPMPSPTETATRAISPSITPSSDAQSAAGASAWVFTLLITLAVLVCCCCCCCFWLGSIGALAFILHKRTEKYTPISSEENHSHYNATGGQ